MKKKNIRLLVILVSIIILAIGVLNTPSFNGNYLKSSFTNKIVLENSRKEKNKPTIRKPIQFTQEYGEEGLNSKEIYELNNKHIIYIKTYKNKMFYPIHYIPDEECYLNIYGEYIIVQNIAVYFKNKWHGLGLNAPLSQIVDKNC